jgi:hypothetical protein
MITDLQKNNIITGRDRNEDKLLIEELIGSEVDQSKLRTMKFLLNFIPLKVLFIIDESLST